MHSEIETTSFHIAELRSERTRVKALLTALASVLVLVVIRGVMSLTQGYAGQAWPFAVLLASMAGFELVWLRFIKRTAAANSVVSNAMWTINILVETLFPTAGLYLQIHTSFIGPQRALTSPVVAIYFLLIILSTLHLSPQLSRIAGALAAAGYTAVSVYDFLWFPSSASNQLLAYGTFFSFAAFMLVAGFTAGAVADQIRLHVISALHEAESRAKLEQDLSLARTIQQGLLPKAPPQIAGFDIAGWNKPADETGGDYFDWQPLADGRLAVSIADVTGHGVGPAIGMAGCRAYARAGLATQTDLRCFLTSLNQLLYQDLPREKFVTLAAGLLNPEDATVDLISAGHGPLLFYSWRDNRFSEYDAQGVPLGLLPQFRYDAPHRLMLGPGDIVVLVTDGFVEWANASDEEFGQARLEEVIRTYRDSSSEEIISEMYAAISKFAGPKPQPDDLTALLLKRI